MTPQEETFSRRRHEIFRSVFETVMTMEICFDLRADYQGQLISLSGDLNMTTLRNQQFLERWDFRTPSGIVSLSVTIGADGPDWNPFVTVTTSDGKASKRFDYSREGHFARPFLIEQIKRINGIA
jgi:hypothetical protein